MADPTTRCPCGHDHAEHAPDTFAKKCARGGCGCGPCRCERCTPQRVVWTITRNDGSPPAQIVGDDLFEPTRTAERKRIIAMLYRSAAAYPAVGYAVRQVAEALEREGNDV